jgi:hypothetical protein
MIELERRKTWDDDDGDACRFRRLPYETDCG